MMIYKAFTQEVILSTWKTNFSHSPFALTPIYSAVFIAPSFSSPLDIF